jgi:NAD(P)-dependent dehydrogenase (short-subunit alcohol dehydrogenase family)
VIGNLSNKTALVTGASRGIGRATALALASRGAYVLVHYRNGAAEAEAVVAEIARGGGKADTAHADLSVADGPHALAAQVRNSVGTQLDILVANAGAYKSASIEETTLNDFDELFAVNVRAPFFLVQQLTPVMASGGSIVLVSSLAARTAFGTIAAYAATKGAIDTLVKHFAFALADRGIRVNAVAPGLIAKDGEDQIKTDQRRERASTMQVFKRLGQPEDIGGVVAFLASDDAHWVTGDIVRVDGGSKL